MASSAVIAQSTREENALRRRKKEKLDGGWRHQLPGECPHLANCPSACRAAAGPPALLKVKNAKRREKLRKKNKIYSKAPDTDSHNTLNAQKQMLQWVRMITVTLIFSGWDSQPSSWFSLTAKKLSHSNHVLFIDFLLLDFKFLEWTLEELRWH